MSGSSDSDEFYDAEDLTPNRISRKRSNKGSCTTVNGTDSESSLSIKENDTENDETFRDVVEESQPKPSNEVLGSAPEETFKNIHTVVAEKTEIHHGRSRFRELRQRMQTEDDDTLLNNASPPDSQTSSVEGVFVAPAKVSHPFRIIEHDAMSVQSVTSLGRVGRILSGSVDPSTCGVLWESQRASSSLTVGSAGREEDSSSEASSLRSQRTHRSESGSSPAPTRQASASVDSVEALCRAPGASLQEPDVITSTKPAAKGADVPGPDAAPAPVAPPRRKKKPKTQTPRTQTPPAVEETYTPQSPLPSPASTIESLTREFENSLDIQMATKGQYVVKPQDEEKAKAEGPSAEELARLERLKAELMSVQSSRASSSASVGRGGSGGRRQDSGPRGSRERRRSAGDEQAVMSQLNMFVRTRTDSGKPLTDLEILEQVTVLNLDTGERVPLSVAEDKLPQCINPLSLHIMRLTSEYVSNTNLDKEKESDEESICSKKSELPASEDPDQDQDQDQDQEVGTMRRRTARLKKFLGSKVKKTIGKAKSIAHEVSHARHKEDVMDILDEVNPGEQHIKLKASSSHKGPYEFDSLQHVQDLSGEHNGAVWCMKSSSCGRLLATAGQDRVLRVWVVRSAYTYFQEMRTKYNAEKVSPTPSQESLVSHHSTEDPNASFVDAKSEDLRRCPFMPKPFCTYAGHTSDLLDVSWSKNYFVLSSSMDKTVRLWHISRKECLCCFQHIDFVTAIAFHPRDDRYFLSGSLDGKLRLWNIPDKKVAVWNEVDGQTKLITTANFCQNGKFAVVGLYDGRCIFYNTDQLKYHTQIHVRSTRGKNSTGRKISGIEPMPGEDKILVTSNDSRIRLYDLRDLNLSCKYKGYVNVSSQIKASFSHDGKYIISGSENQCIYIWKTHHDYAKFSSVRRDRNDFWEGIKAHNAVVTCAVFVPNPDSIIKMIEEQIGNNSNESLKVEDPVVEQRTKGCGGYVLVSADFNGCIKVFLNKTKPKHSSLPASALA